MRAPVNGSVSSLPASRSPSAWRSSARAAAARRAAGTQRVVADRPARLGPRADRHRHDLAAAAQRQRERGDGLGGRLDRAVRHGLLDVPGIAGAKGRAAAAETSTSSRPGEGGGAVVASSVSSSPDWMYHQAALGRAEQGDVARGDHAPRAEILARRELRTGALGDPKEVGGVVHPLILTRAGTIRGRGDVVAGRRPARARPPHGRGDRAAGRRADGGRRFGGRGRRARRASPTRSASRSSAARATTAATASSSRVTCSTRMSKPGSCSPRRASASAGDAATMLASPMRSACPGALS